MIDIEGRSFEFVITEPSEKEGTLEALILNWTEGEPDSTYYHESIPGFGIVRKGPIYNVGNGRNYAFQVLLEKQADDDDEEFDEKVEEWRNAKTSVGIVQLNAAGLEKEWDEMECVSVSESDRKRNSVKLSLNFLRGTIGEA